MNIFLRTEDYCIFYDKREQFSWFQEMSCLKHIFKRGVGEVPVLQDDLSRKFSINFVLRICSW